MSDFPGVPDIDTRGGGEPAEIIDGSEAVIDADVVDAEIVLDATAREMGGPCLD